MEALELLRVELAARRRRGEDFGDAWPAACRHALAGGTRFERGAWAAALIATEQDWRAAYEHEPCRPEALAVVELGRELQA